MKRFLLAAAVATAGFTIAAGATLANDAPPPGWSWLLGRIGEASLGRTTAQSALYVGAYYGGPVPTELSSKKIVISSSLGNFEFEHFPGIPNSTLLATTTSGQPTPVQIGLPDGQNLIPLIVSGASGMTPYLQSWQLSGNQAAGIGPLGHLRLNGVALVPTVGDDGAVQLEALLPDGTTQTLVPVPTKS